MTRQGAERALRELHIYAHNFPDDETRRRTDVQGRWLTVRELFAGEQYAYAYGGDAITKETALVLLENR